MTSLLTLVSALVVSQDLHTDPFTHCADGTVTSLWISRSYPELPRHDGPMGETRFEVRERTTGTVRGQVKQPGLGSCLGFAPAVDAFVISSEFELGSVVPIAAIQLVRQDATVSDTNFTGNFSAFAQVTSATRRFIAFVGQRDSTGLCALWLLDVVRNTVKRLGKAPAPPPQPEAPLLREWTWESAEIGRPVELEPSVLRFDGEVLHVTFGKDTSRARASKRTEQLYRLDARSSAATP